MVDNMFRFTNPGDTFASIGATEKIEFNFSAVSPDDTGRHLVTGFHSRRDTNIHPNPRRVLDQIQDSLLGFIDVKVSGYFVGHATTLGPRNLYNWNIGLAQTANFPVGRFGLTLDSFANGLLNLTPDNTPNTIGYILYDVDVQDIESPRDEVPFTASLYRNGTITEVP
jgi:hypothetical protein